MNRFFRWLFEIPGDPPEPKVVVAQVVARPVVINPTTTDQVTYSEWRAAHIQRYLDHHSNADQPEEHLKHLEAERDMHLAALRMRIS